MMFTSPAFFAFFLVVFVCYWAIDSQRWRKAWLLLTSLFFYGVWDYRFLSLLLGSCALNYGFSRRMKADTALAVRRRYLQAAIAVNLTVLAVFKYHHFFTAQWTALAATLGLGPSGPWAAIVLPLGISFFTFQGLSFVIDSYHHKFSEPPSLLDFTLSIVFFPHLLAGPIVRGIDLIPQLGRRQHWSEVDGRYGLGLFLLGYIKKAVLADTLAAWIDHPFHSPGLYSSFSLLTAAVGFTLQIYFDFSGYTDMARGLARLLGFHLCPNFHSPLLSTNLVDFWRRWHMSLSSWLRDYLYLPLGGNRRGRWSEYRNVLITMTLGGIWHGAGFHYLAWGLLHGVGLVIAKEWKRRRGDYAPLPALLAWSLCFGWVTFCFILFRAPGLQTGLIFLRGLVRGGMDKAVPEYPWLWTAFILWGIFQWGWRREGEAILASLRGLSLERYAALLGSGVALAAFFTAIVEKPFLYFQF